MMEKDGKLGGFSLVRLLGKGGMGEVYEARTPEGERVALKVFANAGAHADFLKKRFLAEGRLLGRLDHPRLVKVHELFADEKGGRACFAMDLLLGPKGEPQTLEDLRRGQSLDEGRIAAIYADLREGLLYLHAQGVVHRDLKLENVLVDAAGRAVLSDFGISRIFDQDLRHELAVTTTAVADEKLPVMGSFGYLSPELKRGEPATPASDAYALGVLVFRLLTGVWYEADSTAMDLLTGFDPVWTNLLSRLLDENPARRLPLPDLDSLRREAARKRRLLVALLLGGMLLLAGGAAAYFASRPHTYTFDEFFPEEVQTP